MSLSTKRSSSALRSGTPSTRPQTPQSLRRPSSSLSVRSKPPSRFSLKRPGTPSSGSSNSSFLSPRQGSNIYTGNIKVSIRVKPDGGHGSPGYTTSELWNVDTLTNTISCKDVGDFMLDNVFEGPISNSLVYNNSVKELVENVMLGYNGTVFAYGMTGTGKTYSMQGTDDNPGIIPLSVDTIFQHISRNPGNQYSVKVSYLEIYNEHLNDLLCPQTSSDDIKLREDPLRGVRAFGLKEVPVNSSSELLQVISDGDLLRRTEGTEFNAKSSRSHAVVQISLTSSTTLSTLYLCDLAGSERAAQQSERRKEGAFINKSLLTLGTIISRLSNGTSTNTSHLPYRDSKLTRLLQPSLSGKSLVSVLCTVYFGNQISSPTNINHLETLSTLRFAARAKNILISAKRNEDQDPSAKIIERLLQQIESQRNEILTLRTNTVSTLLTNNGTSSSNSVAQLEAENRILRERVEHLTRLCDDSHLEEIIGVSSPESKQHSSSSSPQIQEYKSYINHLEKQLYMLEVSQRSSPQQAFDDYAGADSTTSSSLNTPFMSSSANMSTSSLSSNGPSSGYLDVIQDLQDEIAELRESNSDKDRVITALRALKRSGPITSSVNLSHDNFASITATTSNSSRTPSMISNSSTSSSTSKYLSQLDDEQQPRTPVTPMQPYFSSHEPLTKPPLPPPPNPPSLASSAVLPATPDKLVSLRDQQLNSQTVRRVSKHII